MNSHFQSHVSSSSSSSLSENEDETQNDCINIVEHFENKRKAILNDIAQEQELVVAYIIQQEQGTHRGSIRGHVVIHRDREIADRNLLNDYFAENPTYNESMFRRRFRMSRNLFLRIVVVVKNHDAYFTQRNDDATDEYIKIGESTAIECMQRFCRAIVEVFAEQYLRSPTSNDVARLLYIGEQRGFSGMLGSLDCRSGSPTIILEAVADYDLWIWHAYFCIPGSNNDINVLEASDLFSNLAQGIAPTAHYRIGQKEYDMGYYLADGIYPKWSTIVQSIHDPRGPKKKYFAMKQKSCRKDVERAFGVLQSRFAIVALEETSFT
ncbi:uncharacterized protein [Primulina huaijiensis]|uniref:uncharacterized protein n=1 Tax=Primulina huaijiensis TaxID=1492673 RepID=UPI003CC702C3